MIKRFVTMVLCFALILLTGVSAAYAAEGKNVVAESKTVTYLEDGSYLVTTVRTYADPTAPAGAMRQVSGSKTGDLYNSYNEKLISLTVYGIFSCDGHSSQAQSASYSYTIHNMLWSLSTGGAYCEGNTACVRATFNALGTQSTTLSVSLSCSPEGVLS